MSFVPPTIVCLVAYFTGYRCDARFLSRWIFAFDPARTTPAQELEAGPAIELSLTPARSGGWDPQGRG